MWPFWIVQLLILHFGCINQMREPAAHPAAIVKCCDNKEMHSLPLCSRASAASNLSANANAFCVHVAASWNCDASFHLSVHFFFYFCTATYSAVAVWSSDLFSLWQFQNTNLPTFLCLSNGEAVSTESCISALWSNWRPISDARSPTQFCQQCTRKL